MGDRICSFPGCGRPHGSRGYCGGHARQFRLGQSLRPLARNAISQEARFWEKVNKTDTCWLWTGATTEGYGVLRLTKNKRLVKAHRHSYELAGLDIPDGLEVDHLCRVRRCVNPAHLEPVTPRENKVRQPWSAPLFQAAKTHCPQGHEYTDENTRHKVNASGGLSRDCRECFAARSRANYARKKAAAPQ